MTSSGPSAEALLDQARSLIGAGRPDEAETAFARVLEVSPDHPEALSIVALGALRRREFARAIELLEGGTRAHPRDPSLLTSLGLARRAAGDLAGALDAFSRALAEDASAYVARLHQGQALQQLGRGGDAVRVYFRALRDAQTRGRWLNPSTTPKGLRPAVEEAMRFVQQGQKEFLFGLLEPLRQRYGASSLGRVEECVRAYVGETKPALTDPRQRPTFLRFPGIEAQPYLDRRLFPWIEAWEAETATIREELLQVLPGSRGREPVFHTAELARQNLRSEQGPPTWDGYYFYRHGQRREDNCGACPKTAAAIDRLPLARVRGNAPEVMFSVLAPGTHLLPHRGVTNTRVVAHLPLIVPENCALNVAGEAHAWREGRAVVFDDTYEHEAWNRSAHTRVILIVDIWSPHLTEAERAAVAEVAASIGEFRLECERL